MGKRFVFVLLILFSVSSVVFSEDGLITVRSSFSVRETGNRLESALEAKGMKIVARINHAAGAASVDLNLRPTELLIFGNPAVGTPLMQCEQQVGIDLPQKMLIWQDESGVVWLAYNDPHYLAERHTIRGCEENIKKIAGALSNFAKNATSE